MTDVRDQWAAGSTYEELMGRWSVHDMRQTRDRLSAEIADMSHDELVRWLRAHRYADPLLQRLAEKAAQQADAADRPSGGR